MTERHNPRFLWPLLSVSLFACGDAEEREPSNSSSSSSSSGGEEQPADCDPRQSSPPGGSGSGGQGSGEIVVDPDAGGGMPNARSDCALCEGALGGALTCCELKGVCYDPSTEADFCLRPYCD